MTEWKYVTSSNIERKNDYLIDLDYDDGNGNGNDNDIELPIPVRLVYLQDETGCISKRQCRNASHYIGSSYDLDEWIEQININKSLKYKKCIYLTTLIPNMFEKCINMITEHTRDAKYNQYKQKSINVIQNFLHDIDNH
eukprot:476391_1